MRRFTHPQDTLAYANETVWTYARDPDTGRQVHRKRVPEPEYTLRCFVLARVVKQFHHHARFDPAATALPAGELGRRTRAVLKRSPRARSDDARRIPLPGFANLREFSRTHETLLKREAGGAWQSYFQRGHWRMLFPFSRRSQEREARRLAEAVRADAVPVVHVFTFPALTVNHAIVLHAVTETPAALRFLAYDPNDPDAVLEFDFDLARREFHLPATAYFIGGPVMAYEVFRNLWR